MSIPEVRLTVADGALGILPIGSNNIRVKIGVAPLATANTIYAINSIDDVKNNLVSGPLAEACAYDVQIAGPGLLAVPITSTVAPAAAFSSVVQSGSGPTITLTNSVPVDCYDVIVTVTTAGAIGTSKFTYSLDNGITTQGPFATAATYDLKEPNSSGTFGDPKIKLNMAAGSYVVGETYTFRTFAPHYAAGDCATAISKLNVDARVYSTIHFVGWNAGSATDATNLSAANTFLGAASTQLATLTNSYRYIRAYIDTPDIVAGGDWTSAMDTSIISAITATDTRLRAGAGYAYVYSALTGLARRRCATWPYLARVGQNFANNAIADDPAWVGSPLGSLRGVRGLIRNERANAVLHDAGLITLRDHLGQRGVYATSSVTRAPVGSDYTYDPNGFVVDLFSLTVRSAALPFLNSAVRVNPDGTIYELDALYIERAVGNACNNALLTPGFCSPPTPTTPMVQVNRTNNLLSTGNLKIRGRITPLGYNRAIDIDIGFNNVATVGVLSA